MTWSAVPARPVSAARVIFADSTEIWWLKALKPGFRHCFVAVAEEPGWVVVDPLSHCTQVHLFHFDPAPHYREAGLTVLETWRHAAPLRALAWRPYSCVEEVKRLLGMHAPWVWTPWQLFLHIQKDKNKIIDGAAPAMLSPCLSTPEPRPDPS